MPESKTPLLDTIKEPADTRALSAVQLRQLADELRAETIDAVAQTGGHLGAGLGVVELTVALHHVFDTPDDILIWDVGHQAYPHKILTGRRDRIRSLRQGGGLSGFTKRTESAYDPCGAAHASTSISAALGFAVARDLDGRDNNVVAVIGDGAMSAGMAFEAMNNAGSLDTRLIVILNDNDMSIAPPVGAMSAYLSRLLSSRPYRGLRHFAKQLAQKLPEPLERTARRAEEYARGLITGGTLFEELGFFYVGPIDGHNLDHLLPVLRNVKEARRTNPILVHVVTQKGKGYPPAEESADKFHGVSRFDIVTGAQAKAKPNAPSYTSVFSDQLVREGERDDKIVAVTAAMPGGTKLEIFKEEIPERYFDVGIAEGHAALFASGLASAGLKPFLSIYSTFMQRAYDMIIHDIALQKLPVRLCMDRGGLSGDDGPTHHGLFDIGYLRHVPNIVHMQPIDEEEFVDMLWTMSNYEDGPIAVRYPRGPGVGATPKDQPVLLEIGKGELVQDGHDVALIGLGFLFDLAVEAKDRLEGEGHSVALVNPRFIKPLDEELILDVARRCKVICTFEDHVLKNGFGASIIELLHDADIDTPVERIGWPDQFVEHGKVNILREKHGISANAAVEKVLRHLPRQVATA